MPVLLLFDGLRPRFSRTPKCFLFLLILAAADGICNRVFQSNYLFLREGPAGSILAVLQQAAGPFYILALAALVWCVWGILYGGGCGGFAFAAPPAVKIFFGGRAPVPFVF